MSYCACLWSWCLHCPRRWSFVSLPQRSLPSTCMRPNYIVVMYMYQTLLQYFAVTVNQAAEQYGIDKKSVFSALTKMSSTKHFRIILWSILLGRFQILLKIEYRYSNNRHQKKPLSCSCYKILMIPDSIFPGANSYRRKREIYTIKLLMLVWQQARPSSVVGCRRPAQVVLLFVTYTNPHTIYGTRCIESEPNTIITTLLTVHNRVALGADCTYKFAVNIW